MGWLRRVPVSDEHQAGEGAGLQWVSNIKFIAPGEKAPAYFYQDDFKITVNANGELVVLHEEDLVGANFRCPGPKE